MNIFENHAAIVGDYASYIRSFINIADPEISRKVDTELAAGKLWPDPLLQFNPAYEMAGDVGSVVRELSLNQRIADVFSGYSLYRHQVEAIKLGREGRDFVVTSGTGSGKSLTYIATIFNALFNQPAAEGVTAVVVYPMNALINSQTLEFNGYAENFRRAVGADLPITYGQYTGQEKEQRRQQMRENPPHILLTNYMMLELLLTRTQERPIRDAIYANLKYLVFDELHTYRGRQGADIAMLIRRITSQCRHEIRCIGTSATMVSAAEPKSQREQVATVAETIFGRPFMPDQIVDETLDRSLEYSGQVADSDAMRRAMQAGITPDADERELRKHPIANWLENVIAVEERHSNLRRRKPMTVTQVVNALATAAAVTPDEARETIARMLLWISNVNEGIRKGGKRYTILPFKLHQFIAQTGSVYTTLDQGPNRFITLEPGLYKTDDANEKPIFPNVFSRATGHPFLCVSRDGNRLIPREFRERTDDEDDLTSTDGYLIVGDEIWHPEEDLELLPDSWVKRTKAGELRAEKKYEPLLPRQIWFDEYGNCSDSGPMKYQGWFMRAPLLFDPTGGVFFDRQTKDATKLTKLGSEGRSTSTTITAFSVLKQLDLAGYQPQDQKLLSFTDNRQDAALQAGHFNDFLQVVQLRSAIHTALKAAPGGTLTFKDIGRAVFDALRLPFLQFANSTAEPHIAAVRRGYEDALERFLFYRAVADLRRSWRIVLPNLEQCGLLDIDYEYLDDLAAADSLWFDDPIIGPLPTPTRREFLRTILDFFRLEYALHSENFLTPSRLKENEKEFREKLRAPWTLDRKEQLHEPYVLRMVPLRKGSRLFSKSLGPASTLGKFLKHFVRQKELHVDLRGDEYGRYVSALLTKLVGEQFLHLQEAKAEDGSPASVYRLRIERVIWRLGDGETVTPDAIKRRSYRVQTPRPNEFFREMYRRGVSSGKRLRAEDHTGQLNTDDRRDREDRFRADWWLDETKKQRDEARIRNESISALFCSPTMELGVDIGGLTVVHMRNAPPNAANYAQRSGRAGRSGQGALIFTYCSGYSPHDRHFFDNQADLVSGAVQPPRLDLRNQELLRTHLNALAISETSLPGLDISKGEKPSLMMLVEDTAELPLKAGVREGLTLQPQTYDRIRASFAQIINRLPHGVMKSASWYSDTWIDQNLSALVQHLDESLNRWRALYRSARTLLTRATQPLESGLLKVGSDEYRKYRRLQDQANRQLNLLRNEVDGSSELTEFYPYRYLASEGFLPGYNFTRLPLRVFVATGEGSGDFISRPRHIALREFGPQNVIYHSGRKFRVSQMIVQDIDNSLTSAKVSKKAGYFLDGDERHLEICPFTERSLSDTANAETLHDLIEASEARAEEIDRISCEEEERLSRGYDIATFFAVEGGQRERVKRAVVRSSESLLLNLRYIPAARLVHVNKKWRSTRFEGFPIGMTSGDWRSSLPEDPTQFKETFKPVKVKTSTIADALYIEPIEPLGLDAKGVVTLQYALKRAIESVFQAEPNEIGVAALGDPEAPNILVYESAEGSLGILSQFVESPDAFQLVVRQAISICRFDDDQYKAPASYDDLLSYYNQRDHKAINRFLIRDALDKLAASTIEIISNEQFGDYHEHYEWMMRNLDPNSSTERHFIQHLFEHGIRLPDDAQRKVDGIYCQPDFYYEPRIWIFCDGSPHDDPEVAKRDAEQRQLIIARGDEVWSWNYREDLAAKIAQRPDIFSKVR